MKNLKIGKKLFISYAVVLVLLVLGTVVSIFNLRSLGDQIETFYDGPFTVKSSANTIDTQFEAMQKAVFRSIANEDETITAEAVGNAKKHAEEIQEQLPIVEEHFLGDKEIVNRLKAALEELAPMREEVLELASQNKNAEAAIYMDVHNIPVIEKAQKELDALITTVDKNGETLITSLDSAVARTIILLIILGVASILVSVAFGVYIAKGITVPVAQLLSAAKSLAAGHLEEATVDYESKDELGHLATSIRDLSESLTAIISDEDYLLGEMAKGNFDVHTKNEEKYVGDYMAILKSMRLINTSLSDTLSQINESSEQVASGSDQVASGAQALSQGATEQASSVEELAATINEISSQVEKNAESALEASRKAMSVGDEASESNSRMQEMLHAITEISSTSNEIGKIIKTIEDIAFQTNILALNAAVEAARAGAAGKGFAVVADEVRNLASKSAEASQNTAALIESSLRAVENGTKIANETAQSLDKVVNGVQEVTGTIEQISTASNQQADSVRQVTQGVDQISSVVQTNSATAEESAAASEELSGQSQLLKDLVSRFTLKKEGRKVEHPVTIPQDEVSDQQVYSRPQTTVIGSKY